jgi:hypothetical protein
MSLPTYIHRLVDDYKATPANTKQIKLNKLTKELEDYLLLNELNNADLANSYNYLQDYKNNFINKIK